MTNAVKSLFYSIGVLPFWVVFEPRALRFPFFGKARIVEDESDADDAAEQGCKVVELLAVDEEAQKFRRIVDAVRARERKGVLAWARFLRRWLKNEEVGADVEVWAGEEAAEVLKALGFVKAETTLSPRELMLLLRQRNKRA